MANNTVSIIIRFKQHGRRDTAAAAYSGKARLKEGIGIRKKKEIACPGGIYYIRWYEGKTLKAKKVGTDPNEVLRAQIQQEDILAGKRPPVEQSSPVPRTKLAVAIEDFLSERSTQTDERGVARWKWELNLFAEVSGKSYLADVCRADCFAYMKWYQQRKKAPRTVYNRLVSIGVFLKQAKHAVDFIFSQRSDGGDIPDYAEKAVDRYYALDLKKFFAECDVQDRENEAKVKLIGETRLRYLFFLDTGCREREVMFACQSDFSFELEGSEFASTYEVCPKPDLGFKTKKGKTRVVPLTPRLANALQTWFAVIGDRRLVFTNRNGGPEGHFLYKLKNIALKAGLNCGHCRTGKKDEWGNIIPGTELYCKTSPVCRQWTLHKMRRTWATMLLEQPGVNIYEVQARIGHSDLEMLKRYNAVAQARSPRSQKQMNEFAESLEV